MKTFKNAVLDITVILIIALSSTIGLASPRSPCYLQSSSIACFKPIALGSGGTGKALTADNGGMIYSDADSMEVLAAGSSGQLLMSNGASAPSWVDTITTAKRFSAGPIEISSVDLSGSFATGALATGGTQANAGITMHTQADSSLIRMRRVNGTIGAPTVASGDIADIQFELYDGDQFHSAAVIKASSDGTVADNDVPGKIAFYTVADGGTTSTLRLTLNNSGGMKLGGGSGVALWQQQASSGTSCTTQCENTDASVGGANSASGRCLFVWNDSTGSPTPACSDTAATYRCFCAGSY